MKKFSILLLVLTLVLGLSACGGEEPAPTPTEAPSEAPTEAPTEAPCAHIPDIDDDCTTATTCKLCGIVLEEGEEAHAFADKMTARGDQHGYWCTREGCTSAKELGYHKGGSADCTSGAICRICGKEYTNKDERYHPSDDCTYTDNGDGTHQRVYICCGAVAAQAEKHSYDATGACGCGVCVFSYDSKTNTRSVWDAEGLIVAIGYDGNVELTKDIDVSQRYGWETKIYKKVTLNLNGHSITGKDSIFWVGDGGVLTVQGEGGLKVKEKDLDSTICVDEDGIVNIYSGTIESTVSAEFGGVLNIFGGTFEKIYIIEGGIATIADCTVSDYVEIDESTASITGGTFSNDLYMGESTVTVTGGTFNGYITVNDSTNITISGGTFNESVSIFNATATIDGGTFNGTIPVNNSDLTVIGGAFRNRSSILEYIPETHTITKTGSLYVVTAK